MSDSMTRQTLATHPQLTDVETDAFETFASEINRVICPPTEVAASRIHVRAMLLVSDQVNHYGGRFDSTGLDSIGALVIDSPILIGHRKDRLPIGRVFKSELVTVDGETWVKVWFYWLSGAEGSETLRYNIDGGIYKECSLGFTFARPECAECGADARYCDHAAHAPEFIYRDIQRVLEVSLVYRGATPRTRVGAELVTQDLADEEYRVSQGLTVRSVCAPPDTVSTTSECVGRLIAAGALVDGLPLFIERRDGELRVLRDDLKAAPQSLVEFLENRFSDLSAALPPDCLIYGRLVGMRGKERRTMRELVRRITERAGPVRSAKFMALALVSGADLPDQADEFMRERKFLCEVARRSQFIGVIPAVETLVAEEGSSEALYRTSAEEFVIVRRPRTLDVTMCGDSEGVSKATLEESGRCCSADVSIEPGQAALVRADDCVVGDPVALRNARLVTPLYDLVGEETLAPMVASEEIPAGMFDVSSVVAKDHIVVAAGERVPLFPGARCTVRDKRGAQYPGRVVTLRDGDVTRRAIFLSREVAA